MKKILIIDSLMGNDYTICLANAMQMAGGNITLIVPENREINNPLFVVKKWLPSKEKTKSKLSKVFDALIYLIKLINFIVKQKPDAVHFQFFRFKIDALLMFLLKIFNLKIIYTAHNVLPHERFMFDIQLTNLAYKAADKIIVHSNFIKEKLLSLFEIDCSKIEIIPHGNFNHYLPEAPLTSNTAKNKLSLSPQDNVALFFGYIKEYKGLDILLNAFEIIYKNKKNIKLLIAGFPESEELKCKYEKMIGQIDADNRIIFYPEYISPSDLPIFFYAADVLILPYKTIDHSGIIHLAYSFNKPVIVTNVGDFSDTVEEGKSGFIVPPNNPIQLAGCIECAFSNKKNLLEMGSYAGTLNNSKYSWDVIAAKTLGIY